jgi:hypothetical protein
MNARQIIARKAEFAAQKEAQEYGAEFEIDDGVDDSDLEGGVSPAFTVTDDTLKKSLEQQPKQHAEAPKPKKYSLKVNGQDMELTEEEVLARAQKVEAADQYLAEKKREADLLLAEAKLKAEQPSVQTDVAPAEVSDEDLELVRALQVGDEYTAAKALKTRIASMRQLQPTINPDVIAAKVKDDMDHQRAKEWFFKEYSDIAQDQKLMMIATSLDADYRKMDLAEHKATPYMDRYRAIGEEVRKWKGTSPEFEEKKNQKKETLRTIPQASVRQAPVVEDEQEESYSDVIAKMAQARGQQHIGG